MSKRTLDVVNDDHNEELNTSKRQKPNPFDQFPSSSSYSYDDEEDNSISSSDESIGTYSSSSLQSYNEEDDNEDEEESSNIESSLDQEDLIVVNNEKEQHIDRPKWFKQEDIIHIGRYYHKNGPNKDVNLSNKSKEVFSVDIHIISNGSRIKKVKMPYGSVNQELYDKVFILKHKVCNYDKKLIQACIEDEETHNLYMIDLPYFHHWLKLNDDTQEEDDKEEEEEDENEQKEDKATVESDIENDL